MDNDNIEEVGRRGRRIKPTLAQTWTVRKVGATDLNDLASKYTEADISIMDNNAHFLDKIEALKNRLAYWEHGIRYHFRAWLVFTLVGCVGGYIFSDYIIEPLIALPIYKEVWSSTILTLLLYSIYNVADIGKLMFAYKPTYNKASTIRDIDEVILAMLEPTKEVGDGEWFTTTEIAEVLALEEGYPVRQLGRDLKRLDFKHKRSGRGSLYLVKIIEEPINPKEHV